MSWWSSATTNNIIDQSVSSMTSVGNITKQICAPVAMSAITLSLVSCGDLVIRGNTFSQKQEMNVKCVQTAAQQANSQTNVDQKSDQLAKSLTAALSLTPGSAEANNIAKMSTAVGNVVRNEVDQAVASATGTALNISASTCPSSPDYVPSASHNLSFLDNQLGQYSSTYADLTQNSTQIASAVNDLKQYIKQVADAKKPGLFGDIGPIVGVIVAVVALALAAKMMRARSGLVHGGAGPALVATILSLAALAGAIFAMKKSDTGAAATAATTVSGFCSATM